MNKSIFYLITIIIIFFQVSCKKSFLDVSDELAEERNMEKIFSNPADVKRWHANIYTGIPNTADYARGFTGLNHPWPFLTDEAKIHGGGGNMNLTPHDPSITTYGRWGLYQLIRQANLFLENAVEIPKAGDADFISLEEINGLKTEARFLRAYYHYLLFELYGPIPIVASSADPSDKNLDYARNSVDEVVDFLFAELTAVANELKDPNLGNQDRLAVPTKGTALAVRARLMMYAASPLFNGKYSEALSITNNDGKRLFPDFSNGKWNKALQAIKEFIDYAESGHYELYKVNTDGEYDPDKSLYELHMKYNKEIIFARSDVSWGTVPLVGVDGFSVPRGARGGSSVSGYINVTQELVDDFFVNDGLTIEESSLYREDGFSISGEDRTGRTEMGIHRMYINREPRFYQTVFYNGRKWHVGNEQIWFNKGGNSDNSSTQHAVTGYILYKRLSNRVYNIGSNPRSEYRPATIFRLAEFYLLYAEALNEVDPSSPLILKYIDKVRERAGIPLLSNIKSNIIGDQDLQRKAVRQEMRVELATEGQRYFDVRRWMIAENPSGEGAQGGSFYGMDLNAQDIEDFYKRKIIENRTWKTAMYLYPIPINEIQNSKLLVQNPGY